MTRRDRVSQVIGDVRGCGLFVGVDLIEPGKEDPRAPNTVSSVFKWSHIKHFIDILRVP